MEKENSNAASVDALVTNCDRINMKEYKSWLICGQGF